MSEVCLVVLKLHHLVREDEDSRGNSVSLLGDSVQELEDRSKAGAVLTSHQHQAAAHWVSEGDKGSAENKQFNLFSSPPLSPLYTPTVGPSAPAFLVLDVFGVCRY